MFVVASQDNAATFGAEGLDRSRQRPQDGLDLDPAEGGLGRADPVAGAVGEDGIEVFLDTAAVCGTLADEQHLAVALFEAGGHGLVTLVAIRLAYPRQPGLAGVVLSQGQFATIQLGCGVICADRRRRRLIENRAVGAVPPIQVVGQRVTGWHFVRSCSIFSLPKSVLVVHLAAASRPAPTSGGAPVRLSLPGQKGGVFGRDAWIICPDVGVGNIFLCSFSIHNPLNQRQKWRQAAAAGPGAPV